MDEDAVGRVQGQNLAAHNLAPQTRLICVSNPKPLEQ